MKKAAMKADQNYTFTLRKVNFNIFRYSSCG